MDNYINLKENLDVIEEKLSSLNNNDTYYKLIQDDYKNERIVPISITEYKYMILSEYFIINALKENIKKWSKYKKIKENSIKEYNLTSAIADKIIQEDK